MAAMRDWVVVVAGVLVHVCLHAGWMNETASSLAMIGA